MRRASPSTIARSSMAERRHLAAPRRRFAVGSGAIAAVLGLALGLLPAGSSAQVPPPAPTGAPAPGAEAMSSPAPAVAATCTDANLLRTALVTGFNTEGIARRAQ